MANIKKKTEHLCELLKQAKRLTKEAEQKITHKDLEAAQPTIGDDMQKLVEQGTNGKYASDDSVDAEIKGVGGVDPKTVEGDADKPAAQVIKETGNSVDVQTPSGDAATLTKVQACLNACMEKRASYARMVKEATSEEIPTATETLNKIASLSNATTEDEIAALTKDIESDFVKLAAYNPLFNEACEAVMFRKLAAEAEALAEAEGISPEEAAAALDAATASDPEAIAELENEVQGEALADLAEEEQAGAEMMAGLEDTAAQVSEVIGAPVTADDLVAATEQVVAQAEEMGVAPEVLMQAALEDMMAAEDTEVTEEDMQDAETILEEAAASGISPEEVIQALSGELDAEGAPVEEVPTEEAPVEETPTEEAPTETIEKEACLKKLASTRRGANLAYILSQRG